MTNLVLEPAAPEEEKLAAELIHATASEIMDYIFGGRAESLRHLARHWIASQGLFSHAHATVARHQERFCGLEIGYPPAQMAAQARETVALYRSDLSADEFSGVMTRAKDVDRLDAAMPDDCYYVMHLAVVEAGRGKGWGRTLLQNAFTQARNGGYASVHLGVMSNNPAFQFYLGNGMHADMEIILHGLQRDHGIPGCIHMIHELD